MIKNRVDNNRRLLYCEIRDRFGFDVLETDEITKSDIAKYDAVMIDPRKYFHKKTYTKTIDVLNSKAKIILYVLDPELPTKSNNEYCFLQYLEGRELFYENAHIILGDSFEFISHLYADKWHDWNKKYIWWPKCIADIQAYFPLKYNAKPVMRCYLSGKLKDEYPIRAYAAKLSLDCVDTVLHPGYKKLENYNNTGLEYAKKLNEYYCCLCGAKIYGNVLEKHMIIPAAWSLLIADSFKDLSKAGFIPGYHYVEVNNENLQETIEHAISHPKNYENIRKNGRSFVMENHTIKNRMETFGKVLDEYF